MKPGSRAAAEQTQKSLEEPAGQTRGGSGANEARDHTCTPGPSKL